MTSNEVAWAKTHDWFIDTGTDYIGTFVYVRDDMQAGSKIRFDSAAALYTWAGY